MKSFKRVRAFQIELEFGMLVFEEMEKAEYPEKNLSEQRREPTTNSTHIWRRGRDLTIVCNTRSSLWLKMLTFFFAGNTNKGSPGRTSSIQRKEITAIQGRIRKQKFPYLISMNE